ncbi:MAG: hypothetical protein QXY62_06335 [Candidatus Altiarchaeota archaeon]
MEMKTKPKIHLYLDVLDLEKAFENLEKFSDVADWIGLSSNLIKYEGLKSIEKIKNKFPGKKIAADIKPNLDDIEKVVQSNADIIILPGGIKEQDMENFVKLGKQHNKEIVIDLRNEKIEEIPDFLKLGVDYALLTHEQTEKFSSVMDVPIVVNLSRNNFDTIDEVISNASVFTLSSSTIESSALEKEDIYKILQVPSKTKEFFEIERKVIELLKDWEEKQRAIFEEERMKLEIERMRVEKEWERIKKREEYLLKKEEELDKILERKQEEKFSEQLKDLEEKRKKIEEDKKSIRMMISLIEETKQKLNKEKEEIELEKKKLKEENEKISSELKLIGIKSLEELPILVQRFMEIQRKIEKERSEIEIERKNLEKEKLKLEEEKTKEINFDERRLKLEKELNQVEQDLIKLKEKHLEIEKEQEVKNYKENKKELINKLIDIINDEREVELGALAKKLKVSSKLVEIWCNILERKQVIKTDKLPTGEIMIKKGALMEKFA